MILLARCVVVDCGHVPSIQSASQRRRHGRALRRARAQPPGGRQGQAGRADEPGPGRPPGRGGRAGAWGGADARPVGAAWLLDALWAKLEVGTSIRRIADGRRFTTAVERVLFALVCNRAIEPMSKLSAAEWVTEDVVIPGLGGMDDDQAYRAMDLLVEADTQGQVQEAVFFAVANLLNLEVDLLFFDTTSTYFEADEDQDEPS